jgi:6-pyruvoyltetrahydropterin/6-carboxytetrahydropterin synthase
MSHVVTLCRKISFSSGHRYHNPTWSEDENRRVYGSQYSAHGHGHNYELVAHLSGEIDTSTGMVMNLTDVDRILRDVVAPLDHYFLNSDVPFFRKLVPTTENIARYCFEGICQRLKESNIRLLKVRLYEGRDLWIDYGDLLDA